jgi:hypothetical protein
MLARMPSAGPRTVRKLRSTDHLLSCCVYGERFGRCVLRPGDACKLVGAGPLKPRADAVESGFPPATPLYGSDSKSVQRPRPTRKRGVGLLLLLPQKSSLSESSPSFRRGVARTARRSTCGLSPHTRPDCKQFACKIGQKTSQRAPFTWLLDAGNPVGRGLWLEESPAGALASRRPPKQSRRLFSRRRCRVVSSVAAEPRFTFLKGL